MDAVLLAENLLNPVQFPLHDVTASTETAGMEAFRVGTGRRSRVTNRWRPTTGENVEAWVAAEFDRVRGFDFIALDRGHNLAGKTVVVEISDDDFATSEAVFDGVVPSAAGGTLDGPVGAVTPEGAWLKRFTARAAKAVRLRIPAQANLLPEVVGLYVGQSYAPGFLDKPWSDETARLLVQAQENAHGWTGAGIRNRRRQGTLNLKLDSYHAYALARYHVQQRFHDEYAPTWIVMDAAEAYRAQLATAVPGSALGFEFAGRDWAYRSASVQFVEHEPAPR